MMFIEAGAEYTQTGFRKFTEKMNIPVLLEKLAVTGVDTDLKALSMKDYLR